MRPNIQLRSAASLCNLAAAALFCAGCAEFPDKYENVIADAKIRPFAIVLDPPEAAPGDTVHAALKLYDAGKPYTVRWSLALKFQVKQGVTGSPFPTASEWIDLDSGAAAAVAANGLSLSLRVPDGARNPLHRSGYVSEVIAVNGLSAAERTLLPEIGIEASAGGIPREILLTALASHAELPNGLAPLVDGFLAIVQLRAHVTAPGFALEVTKNLTVRYSNRLSPGAYASNVNANPRLDSIGFIHVHAKGVSDFGKIAGYASDTLYFKTSAETGEAPLGYDTLRVVPEDSYFLIASRGAAQTYRSPQGLTHDEQVLYQWFYTNLDAPGRNWEDLIVFPESDQPLDFAVVPIRFPAQPAGLRRFAIRATVGDSRPEWGVLSSSGLGYAACFGWIEYP